ncbi:MAG TPA: hypothetical protein PL009_07990 [Flavipsychrobacter sp.]|nr:hypothetical protein [Flavipsychrobacter sp.]
MMYSSIAVHLWLPELCFSLVMAGFGSILFPQALAASPKAQNHTHYALPAATNAHCTAPKPLVTVTKALETVICIHNTVASVLVYAGKALMTVDRTVNVVANGLGNASSALVASPKALVIVKCALGKLVNPSGNFGNDSGKSRVVAEKHDCFIAQTDIVCVLQANLLNRCRGSPRQEFSGTAIMAMPSILFNSFHH